MSFMRQKFNQLSDEQLISAAQAEVKSEIRRKLSEGKPVSYYDPVVKKVYRVSPSGERVYE